MTEEKKPKLEVGREYKIGGGFRPPNLPHSGTYLGYLDEGPYLDMHVFIIEDSGKRTYAFYSDHWIQEIDETLTYPFYSSFTPQYLSGEYIKQKLIPKSKEKINNGERLLWEHNLGLLNILKKLGVEI